MVNDSLVSVINTAVFGRSKKYPLEDISEELLVQWAVETLQQLQANPELAKAKRLLVDSITPEAKESLWGCSEELAKVPKEYPEATLSVANRVIFHNEWLQKIIDACAPSSTPLVLNEMRKVKWGEGAGEGAVNWKSRDVTVYFAKLKALEAKQGGAMSLVSEKAKLDVVEHKIPSGLKLLAKATLPRHDGVGPPPADTWEKALTRIAHNMRKQEDAAAMAETIKIKQKHDAPTNTSWKRKRDERGGEQKKVFNTFKPKKWRPGSSSFSGADRRERGKGKGSGKGSRGKGARGGKGGETNISHIECYNCNKKGHYASSCPDAPKESSRGGGKGRGKGFDRRGGGKGASDTQKDAGRG